MNTTLQLSFKVTVNDDADEARALDALLQAMPDLVDSLEAVDIICDLEEAEETATVRSSFSLDN